MKDILLITPPFTQLNTPYPATTYLKGFLNTKGYSSFQMDLGIEVTLALFSKNGLDDVFDFAEKNVKNPSENSLRMLALKDHYINTVDDVIRFLQGGNEALARAIATGNYLPRAGRFTDLDYLDWGFGNMGLHDKAKHLATLYLEDLSDFIKACVDADFGVSRYAESLGQSANSFDELYERLGRKPSFVEDVSKRILDKTLLDISPKLVCISVPFPGNLLGALRCGQHIKLTHPNIKVAMGGGFANTELRGLRDVRVFEFFDFISLDDGELPLELLAELVIKHNPATTAESMLKRTFHLDHGEVFYNNLSLLKDYKQHELGTPDYADLTLNQYLSVIEVANPMHSLWSDGKWLKLTMAHGCYWGKCTFCDISLDYIKNYEPVTAALLVDRMESMIAQTGEKGFHFVDEAAPPALMRELALEIIRRKLVVSWWTNIRFEKNFSADLCRLLQISGCIAVSGGLEVASNRLLKLIDKGVTVEQVARVTRNFTDADIMVHAYLMYGYPSQTVQETIDSLEMVRQLFEQGVLQSGFWHQFSLTAHSPVGLNPEKYGVTPILVDAPFAHNDIDFDDETGINHDRFRDGLNKSLYNFMHGICFDSKLQEWFDFKIPKTTIKPEYIEQALQNDLDSNFRPSAKIVFIGVMPISEVDKTSTNMSLTFHGQTESMIVEMEKKLIEWWVRTLSILAVSNRNATTLGEIQADYESHFQDFETHWFSEEVHAIREMGLLVL